MNKNIVKSLCAILIMGLSLNSACSDPSKMTKQVTITNGQDTLIASQLAAVLAQYGKDDKPGVVFMAKYDDGTTYEGAIGLASLDPPKALVTSDIFNLASVSKQFTAFAILLLQQDGKLKVDQSLYQYIPELGEYVKPITIGHLISHTSGLSDYMELAFRAGKDYRYALSSAESLQQICTLTKTEFEPGTKYDYSNTGYFLLAQIIERVSGTSLKEFCEQRIFKPLGMNSTFIVDSYPMDRHCVLSYDESDEIDQVDWTHTGDGQVHSNVHDLMLWGENMSTGKVGGIDLINKFSTSFPPTTSDGREVVDYEPYGYGVLREKVNEVEVLQHSGGWMSYGSNFIRIPSKKLTIAVLTNSANISAVDLSHQVATILTK